VSDTSDAGPGAEGARTTLERLAKLTDAVYKPVLDILDDLGQTVVLGARALSWMARPPYRPSQLLIALDFIGAGSTFIVALVGLFTGMAFTVSTIVGFRQFSAEGMVGGVVALAMARELAPVLASVVVTARAGSTMASELGNMRVTEQIDAITTMGVSPVQYLVSPRVLATTLMMPLLATCFGVAGQSGAYVVAVLWQGIDPGIFFDKIGQFMQVSDIRMLVVKSLVFGLVVSTICCKKGFLASGGARGVGEATAKAVVASIVAIFAFDYVITTAMTDI
jgi:phospholipid/cholesterol/gamma-HCH transport system permease protein